jgi:hypothetical protein
MEVTGEEIDHKTNLAKASEMLQLKVKDFNVVLRGDL